MPWLATKAAVGPFSHPHWSEPRHRFDCLPSIPPAVHRNESHRLMSRQSPRPFIRLVVTGDRRPVFLPAANRQLYLHDSVTIASGTPTCYCRSLGARVRSTKGLAFGFQQGPAKRKAWGHLTEILELQRFYNIRISAELASGVEIFTLPRDGENDHRDGARV